ncbi:MAG: hypothetical protein HYS87_01010 [Candidatus Colwellbacteria bacterium]|nr:hypothetical protein [Candidatus Colwellbacteria bacterium]
MKSVYAEFLNSFLDVSEPLKVVVDNSNGSTGEFAKGAFKHRALELKFLNDKPDGRFPAHGPNPLDHGSTTQLKKTVLKQKADLGVIFDGDGDRALFVDNLGRLIDQDIISRLLINYLKPKKVVIDTSTSDVVRKAFSKDIKVFASKPGPYYIVGVMRARGASYGSERSGHYYFHLKCPRLRGKPKYIYLNSGILSAVFVINAFSEIKKRGLTPAKWANKFRTLYFRFRGEVNAKDRGVVVKKLIEHFRRSGKKVSTADGITVREPGYWFNVRLSKTESVIRITAEAKDKKTLSALRKNLIILIKRFK